MLKSQIAEEDEADDALALALSLSVSDEKAVRGGGYEEVKKGLILHKVHIAREFVDEMM